MLTVPVLKKVIPVTSHEAVPAVVLAERVHDAIDGTTFDPNEILPVGVVGEADVSVTVMVQVVSCPIIMVDRAQETLVLVELSGVTVTFVAGLVLPRNTSLPL